MWRQRTTDTRGVCSLGELSDCLLQPTCQSLICVPASSSLACSKCSKVAAAHTQSPGKAGVLGGRVFTELWSNSVCVLLWQQPATECPPREQGSSTCSHVRLAQHCKVLHMMWAGWVLAFIELLPDIL